MRLHYPPSTSLAVFHRWNAFESEQFVLPPPHLSPSSSRSLVLLTRTVSVAQAYLETLDHLPTTASLVLGMQLYCHHTW